MHREGYTHAVLSGLQQLIVAIDSKADSVAIATDSKTDTELIADLIARLEQVEQKVTAFARPQDSSSLYLPG